MNALNLTRKLTLESLQSLPDGAGGFTQSWQEQGIVWAHVAARTGREKSQAGAVVSTVSYRITVRAAPAGSDQRPEPSQRFRDGARVFAIRAVADADSSGRFLTCFADEEVLA